MNPSYRDMAKHILKHRQPKVKGKKTTEQIKADFISYAMRNYFKNIIDLMIEYYDFLVDPHDHELLLQELFRVQDITVKTVLNTAKKENIVITFKDVYGLTIQFVSYSESQNQFHCNISRDGKLIKDTSTDIDHVTLAGYVADFLEENS